MAGPTLRRWLSISAISLTRNGVTSTFYRDPNDANFGNMRLYGECRVAADHRHDDPVWTEVTQLG